MAVQGRRELNARCGVQLGPLGFGGAPLGDLYEQLDDVQALGCVRHAARQGVHYFDTAPWYGLGLSEKRLGMALRVFPRDQFMLSTKVGRYLRPLAKEPQEWNRRGWRGALANDILFGYSYADVMRQHEDSLHRTGLGRVDCLVIHDMEAAEALAGTDQVSATGTRAALRDGGFQALMDLRSHGRIRAFGAGMNSAEGRAEADYRAWNAEYARFLTGLCPHGGIDFFLLAGTHTLLNLSAWQDGILGLCEEHDIGVVMGGAFNSGILATGAVPGAKYDYADAPDHIVDKVRRLEQVCAEQRVPLAAAALQFPLGHPRVATVIAGCKSEQEVDRAMQTMHTPVPASLWERLKDDGLLPDGVPTPLPQRAAARL
eukprot:TRINITY_DN55421_c0_g1_i1.p1 TRINITY_DN55421_c0_g1~~TRINITY_DN55421_c0_g1_i1.p1  ORF type:complete len:396 (+),score=91.87 TRINITY_DN55421_c0_g1_i1:73-1188(+)